VECELGEGQDAEAGVEQRDLEADVAVLDGLSGAVVKERVEASGGVRAMSAREGGTGCRRSTQGEQTVLLGAGGVDGGDQDGGGERGQVVVR
jgi:hypothetical protein